MYDQRKIIVLGHSNVGKSALAVQLAEKRFITKHESTVEDSYQVYLEVDQQRSRIELIDTAGEEKYEDIRSKQLKEGQGFLLCFSLTDRCSFYSIRRYYQDVINAHSATAASHQSVTKKSSPRPHDDDHGHLSSSLIQSNENLHRYSDPPLSDSYARNQSDLGVGIVLVGTKSDALDPSLDRIVTAEEIYTLCKELHLNYHEVSNRRLNEVSLAVEDLVRICRDKNKIACSCGAAGPQADKKKKCNCREKCAVCHRARISHGNSKDAEAGTEEDPHAHAFVPAPTSSKGDSHHGKTNSTCCSIQ